MSQYSEQRSADYAEKCVIGSILLDENCIDIAMEIVKPDDFFLKVSGAIFGAMIDLRKNEKPINLATLLSVLNDNSVFSSGNGFNYLIDCQNTLPSACRIEHFCSIVRMESLKRKLNLFSEKIKSVEWNCLNDADLEIAKLCDELYSFTDSSSVNPWHDFRSSLEMVYNELSTPEITSRIYSGFNDLDAKLSGFKPGSLTIIAARPAMGKTAFGLNILTNIAFNQNIPAVMFSLEMTTVELVKRIISYSASINGNAITQRRMSEQEWDRLLKVFQERIDSKIFIDDTPAIDISILTERSRRLSRQKNIGVVIVDYLQLMHADGKRVLNREQEVATISRGLKALAKELNIPVIALSQLNRELGNRADKHPIISDLRESGAIEQDADNILFIHREDYYRNDGQKDNIAEIMIAKQRNGPTGIVKLNWQGEFTKFSNLEMPEPTTEDNEN